jgi:hypothetical protein
MANNWIANAVPTKDQWTITVGGTWAAGDTITVTALSKTLVVTFQTGYLTVAAVCTTLAQGYNSQTFTDPSATASPYTGGTAIAECGELTAVAGTTTVVLTAITGGKPMPTFTVSKSSASGTVSISHTVTATGPNFWDNTANWSLGTVPPNTDDVVIDRPVSILYGLAQSAVTLASLTITPRFDQTCTLGLPSRNTLGYEEWRATELAIGATVVSINSGSGLIKINFGSVATTATVYATGTTQDFGRSACQLRGTSASNVVNVLSTSTTTIADVGLGSNSETATFATVRQDAGTLNIGQNVTLTTLTKNGGTASVYCAGTTLSNNGDSYMWKGAWTTVTSYGGTIFDSSADTYTTLTLNNSAVYDSDGNVASKAITNCNMNDASSIVDTAGRLAFGNPISRRGRITVAAS